MSLVDDVFAFLESEGFAGGSTDWTLLRRRVMDAPAADSLVVLTEDGGTAPEQPAQSGIGDSAMQDRGIQIRVRAEAWNGDAAQAKAKAISNALHGQRNVQIGSTRYLRVGAMTAEPVFIGFDSSGRPEYTQSFRMLSLIATGFDDGFNIGFA